MLALVSQKHSPVLACRPTAGANARALATLALPSGQTICPHSLCCLSGQGPNSVVAALCQPAASEAQSRDEIHQSSMLLCWRVQQNIAARTSAQIRSQPLILQPFMTQTLSELDLAWQHEGDERAEQADQSSTLSTGVGRASFYRIASMPGLRSPAAVLGSPAGIRCITFPSLTAAGSDHGQASTQMVLQGACPPGAGESPPPKYSLFIFLSSLFKSSCAEEAEEVARV